MDSLQNNRFMVRIDGVIFGFQKISGISKNIEVEQYVEGGCNDYVHIFPKAVSGANILSLEKGVSMFGSLPFYLVGELLPSLTIEVASRLGIISKEYMFRNLVVTKWEVRELNAMEGNVLIDYFELQYEEFTIKDRITI